MTTSTINIKLILDSCSVREKVELFKQLYKDIASCGIHGDTELAHVNPFEAGILKLLGGAGTVNEATGLVQYFGGGSPPPPPPTSQTVSQTSEFPEELKPYIKDVLSKAQAIQEKRETEGYVPYTGPQQAAFTPEQEQAFAGIQGLVGAGQQYFDPAARLTAASAMSPTSAEIGQYMSPYMQQVVDIQQREARRAADVEQQQLAAQAVGAGGFGGSRQAILEAEQRRNLQTQLGDIQARGLAAAYEDAQARLAAQRQREMAAGAQFGTLGQVAPQQALKELTAVEAVGAQRQAQQQTALDIARQQFEKEQTFPETTLQQYQSVIRGFPLQPTTYQTSQTTTPAPSYLQQAAGLGGLGIGLAGAFGAFKANGGLIRRARGGKLDKNGGLGSIVVKRQEGGNFTPPTRARFEDPAYEAPFGKAIEDLVDALGRGLIDKPTYDRRLSELRQSMGRKSDPMFTLEGGQKFGGKKLGGEKFGGAEFGASRKAVAGLGYADQPVTPSLETEEKAREQARARQLQSVMDALTGSKGAEDLLGPSRFRSKTVSPEVRKAVLEAKQPKEELITPTMLQEVPYAPPSVRMPLSPAPLVEEEKITPEMLQEVPVKKQPSLETENAATKKEEAIKTVSSFTPFTSVAQEMRDKLLSEFDKLGTERKELLKQQKEGLNSDRWLEVANLGASILSQPGGQTFLQAIGKGAKESNIIGNLAKLNKEQRAIAMDISKADAETLMSKYKLKQDEANEIVQNRQLDLKQKEVDADIRSAFAKLQLAKNDAERDAAKLLIEQGKFRLAALKNEREEATVPALSDKMQKQWNKEFKASFESLAKINKDIGKKIKDLDLQSRADLQESYRKQREIIRRQNPDLTQDKIDEVAFTKVYGSYLR